VTEPARFRKWHVANNYEAESCPYCERRIAPGELINVEYELGVCHAACSDAG
jgi:hypothetical protein